MNNNCNLLILGLFILIVVLILTNKKTVEGFAKVVDKDGNLVIVSSTFVSNETDCDSKYYNIEPYIDNGETLGYFCDTKPEVCPYITKNKKDGITTFICSDNKSYKKVNTKGLRKGQNPCQTRAGKRYIKLDGYYNPQKNQWIPNNDNTRCVINPLV
jgi:hypothetical protein